MSHAAFPADAEIQAFIVASGATVPAGFSYVGLGALAQREFETATRRVPFLKDSADVTRSYDPPGGQIGESYGGGSYLELCAGLVTLTSITKDVTAATPSGTLLVSGTDFVMLPLNAPAEGRPWEGVRILSPFYGQPASVRVTGRWGYSATIPEDVWQACLALGAAHASVSVIEGLQTGKLKIKAGEDEITYRAGLENMGSQWSALAARVIGIYKLRTLGL